MKGGVLGASTLDVVSFSVARADEMQALRKALAGNKTRVKRVYQRLSWHARRRTMSHSASRMPRRLRAAHMRELERGGAVCDVGKKLWRRRAKKYRGKARFLKALRRMRVERQMETHVWHAKRFRMSEGLGGGAGIIGVGKEVGKAKGKGKKNEGKRKGTGKKQDKDKDKGNQKAKDEDKRLCQEKEIEIEKGVEEGKDQQGGTVKNNGETETTITTTVATPTVNVKWALTCNDRGVRSMAKAVNRGCVAQDVSFWKTVQIDAGDRLQAKELLLRVTTHDDRRRIITAFNASADEGVEALISTLTAATGAAGQKRVGCTGQGQMSLNKIATETVNPPHAARIVRNVICRDCATGMAVAPMDVMFRTVTPGALVTETATDKESMDTDHAPLTVKDKAAVVREETKEKGGLQKKTRIETWAWIWLRPEVASSGLRALQAAADASCVAGNGNDGDGNENTGMQTLQASYVANAPVRFSVYGPRAEIVLGKVLVADTANAGSEANGRIALPSARGVREGLVLTGLWLRPAPPWVTRATAMAGQKTSCPEPAPSPFLSSLWDDDTRLRLRRHGRAIGTRQGTPSVGTGSGDALATTARNNASTSSTGVVPVPVWLLQRGSRTGDAYGWDVVSACGWGMALWQRLMYANHGRALGDLDLRGVQVMRPRGALFPDEYVDCADAARLVRDRHAAAVAEQMRKPPAKRREIGDGLMSILEGLMSVNNDDMGDGAAGTRQEKEKRRRREVVIVRGVVRIRRLLQWQHPIVGGGGSSKNRDSDGKVQDGDDDDDEEGRAGFVLVRVAVVGKGTPKEGARVRACRLLQCQGKMQGKNGGPGNNKDEDDDTGAESEGPDVGVVVAGSYGLGDGTGVGRALVRLDAMRELMRATVGRMATAVRQRDKASSKNKKTKKSKKTDKDADTDADVVVNLSGKWNISVAAVFRNCEANSVWRRADLSIIF